MVAAFWPDLCDLAGKWKVKVLSILLLPPEAAAVFLALVPILEVPVPAVVAVNVLPWLFVLDVDDLELSEPSVLAAWAA